MHPSTFEGVQDRPVIALAQLCLSRAGLRLSCTSRAQAVSILRSVRPAISKTTPLARVIVARPVVHDACRKCGKPIPFGTPCRVCFNGEIPEHINCKKPSPKKRDAELRSLYKKAIEQISM